MKNGNLEKDKSEKGRTENGNFEKTNQEEKSFRKGRN